MEAMKETEMLLTARTYYSLYSCKRAKTNIAIKKKMSMEAKNHSVMKRTLAHDTTEVESVQPLEVTENTIPWLKT